MNAVMHPLNSATTKTTILVLKCSNVQMFIVVWVEIKAGEMGGGKAGEW